MREVLVKTIVLKGMMEEAIFKQAKKILRDEYLEVKSLKNNDKIINIIQNAKIIAVG
jgi:hypothetical protein